MFNTDMLLKWICGRTPLNPSWFFITQHTTEFVPSEHSGLSSFAHTWINAAWDVPVSQPSSLLTLFTSPRRSQPALNHSRSWCESHWVQPCVSMCHLSLPVTMGCPQTPEAMRVLHLLSAILFLQRPLCKWQEGWQTFGTIAQCLSSQHLHTWQKNAMKSTWEQPCVHALTLDSPVENCPDLAWPNPAWKSHLLLGILSREVEWAAPAPFGNCISATTKNPQLREGTSKQGLPAASKILEIWG